MNTTEIKKEEIKAEAPAANEEAKAAAPAANEKANHVQRTRSNRFGRNNRNNRPNNKNANGSNMEEKLVKIKKICKTTKGGRRMRFSALVVIGNRNGKVGFGIGKSVEVPDAIKKAIKNARNNVYDVLINKKGTMFHEVVGKHAAAKVLIKPAKEGTGIIAGGAIRSVIELAGFKDVYTKNLGKNTPLNMIQATVNGLISQTTPKKVAFLRDKELKDL